MASPKTAPRMTVIRPRPGWSALNFGELWEFRELLWALAERNIRVRYKQTLLGLAWALAHPLVTMVVFTVFLGRLGGLGERTENVPYSLLSLAGLVPWYYFSQGLTAGIASVVDNSHMIGKTYFPRMVLPLAPTLSGLFDLALSAVVLIAIACAFGYPPTVRLLALPLLVLLAAGAVAAGGLWVSGLSAYYRDFRHITAFALQAWMFVSPVAYASTIIPERFRLLYSLNPVVGVIDGFRWCTYGGPFPEQAVSLSVAVVLLTLISGMFVFRRLEATFVDVV